MCGVICLCVCYMCRIKTFFYVLFYFSSLSIEPSSPLFFSVFLFFSCFSFTLKNQLTIGTLWAEFHTQTLVGEDWEMFFFFGGEGEKVERSEQLLQFRLAFVLCLLINWIITSKDSFVYYMICISFSFLFFYLMLSSARNHGTRKNTRKNLIVH